MVCWSCGKPDHCPQPRAIRTAVYFGSGFCEPFYIRGIMFDENTLTFLIIFGLVIGAIVLNFYQKRPLANPLQEIAIKAEHNKIQLQEAALGADFTWFKEV